MSQAAPSPAASSQGASDQASDRLAADRIAVGAFSISRRAVDPRADGASRIIHLTATAVAIERTVEGVRMRLGVPMGAYRDLVICMGTPGDRATLKLRHADSELDVVIGSGAAMDVAKSARAWSSVTGKDIVIEDARITIRNAFLRQRKRVKPSRHSSFARRRKSGVAARLSTSFAGEREIIART